jgi:hypothetical protein
MISNQSRTKEWIMGIREVSPRRDPILIEKMIMALILVENLRLSGLEFIFKGGTSLILLLGIPQRFSIDIDIVLPKSQNLEKCLQAVLDQGIFHLIEESKRAGDLPKQHYKFYFIIVLFKKRKATYCWISCLKKIHTRVFRKLISVRPLFLWKEK